MTVPKSTVDQIENIERKSYQITRGQLVTWALILLNIGYIANKITSNVATKEDIRMLSTKIDAQGIAFTNYKNADSMDKVNIKVSLKADILVNKASIKTIEHKLAMLLRGPKFVQESKDKYGNLIIRGAD